MARSPRRITRRDIRKPDRFVTFTGQIFHIVKQHRALFIGAVGVVIAGLAAFWGWQFYLERQNRSAARHYSRAVDAYHAGRYAEAIEIFNQVKGHTFSSYSRVALLYQARGYLASNDKEKAAASLQELLQKERKPTFMRQLALVNLAYIDEEAGNCKQAAPRFAEAEKIPGPVRDDALLGKARCALKSQDLKGALESYRQHLTDYPQSDRTLEVTLKIQELEQQLSPKITAK